MDEQAASLSTECNYTETKKPLKKRLSLYMWLFSLVLVQPIVHHFWSHYRFYECVCTSFWRLYHFNGFGQSFRGGLKCCYCFLCHGLYCVYFLMKKWLLNFFMNGHTLKDRIVFFDLHPIWRVLFVLFGNVPRSTWHTRFLVLCTLQNYLNPISFLCHCIVLKTLLLLTFWNWYPSIRQRFLFCWWPSTLLMKRSRLPNDLLLARKISFWKRLRRISFWSYW